VRPEALISLAVLLAAPCVADPAPETALPAWCAVQAAPATQEKPAEGATGPEAQSPEKPAPRKHGLWAGDAGEFFKGAALGFVGHETGHLIANLAVGSDPYLKRVDFAFIPFFTIQPDHLLTPREHYITASAGFGAQFLVNEWLLEKHPNLAHEDEPLLKGLAAFNFWLGVGYAVDGFAHYGPDERDTKGMADALGWSEAAVGALVLAPTLLDAYRYRHPDCRWARDVSRGLKVLMFGLALDCDP
jgi:hypothetical protein